MREATLVTLLGVAGLVTSFPYTTPIVENSYVRKNIYSQQYDPMTFIHIPKHSHYGRIWIYNGEVWLELYRRDLYRLIPKNPEPPAEIHRKETIKEL